MYVCMFVEVCFLVNLEIRALFCSHKADVNLELWLRFKVTRALGFGRNLK